MNNNFKGFVKFIINNTNNLKVKGKTMETTVFNDNTVNFYCSCTGNTKETATQMVYDTNEETIKCPHCNKQADEMVETLTQYNERKDNERKKREDKIKLNVVEVNYDWETGIHYYALNKRINYDDWKKVKQYFHYYTYGDWVDCEPTGRRTGWMTRQPDEVKKTLGITE